MCKRRKNSVNVNKSEVIKCSWGGGVETRWFECKLKWRGPGGNRMLKIPGSGHSSRWNHGGLRESYSGRGGLGPECIKEHVEGKVCKGRNGYV